MYSFLLKYALLMGVFGIANMSFAAEQNQESLHLAQAIQQFQQQNTALAARRLDAQALSFQAEQEGRLPDPVLTLGALNFPVDSFSRGQEAMTQIQVGVSQSLPFPGTLGLEAESESHLALAAESGADELQLQLLSRLKTHWWSIFYLDRALDAVSHNQQLLRQLIRIAESKYKVGKGLQQDVLLAQLELSKLLNQKIQLDALRKQEAAYLNTLLNQPAYQVVVLPQQVDELLPSIANQEDLIALAMQKRPRLAEQRHKMGAAQSKLDLADQEDYPEFKLGASYGFRAADSNTGFERADLASLTLSMTMPFFSGDQQDKHKQQRRAELAREDVNWLDAQQTVISDITMALIHYEKAKSQVALLKSGMIPQAQQTVASMHAAYQVNKVDFLNLMRAQVTLYNYETQYWKVFAEAQQALALLDAAVGKDESNE